MSSKKLHKLEKILESVLKDTVHRNPSVSTLKSIAKNSKYETARFVIHKDGSTVAGDAENHTHHSMSPSINDWHSRGYVTHHEGNYVYSTNHPHTGKTIDHPILRHFEKRGIQNGNENINEEGIAVMANTIGSGKIAGAGVGPNGEPGIKKRRKVTLIRRKPINEVRYLNNIKKSDKNSRYGTFNGGRPKEEKVGTKTTHEKLQDNGYKKISSIGHHNIYHSKLHKTSSYIAHNTKTGHIDIGLAAHEKIHKNKSATLSDLGLQSRTGNELKAHHFYKHLIHKHNKILSADAQSEGGKRVWQKLAKEKDVNIHGWDGRKPHNTNPHDEDETHTYDRKTRRELEKDYDRDHTLRNRFNDTEQKIASRKLIASKGKTFKDDRKSLGEETHFRGHRLFNVDDEFFHRCVNGKKKFDRYVNYVGDDETGQNIRQYGLSNPGKPILVKNKSSGAMMYLRYGRY